MASFLKLPSKVFGKKNDTSTKTLNKERRRIVRRSISVPQGLNAQESHKPQPSDYDVNKAPKEKIRKSRIGVYRYRGTLHQDVLKISRPRMKHIDGDSDSDPNQLHSYFSHSEGEDEWDSPSEYSDDEEQQPEDASSRRKYNLDILKKFPGAPSILCTASSRHEVFKPVHPVDVPIDFDHNGNVMVPSQFAKRGQPEGASVHRPSQTNPVQRSASLSYARRYNSTSGTAAHGVFYPTSSQRVWPSAAVYYGGHKTSSSLSVNASARSNGPGHTRSASASVAPSTDSRLPAPPSLIHKEDNLMLFRTPRRENDHHDANLDFPPPFDNSMANGHLHRMRMQPLNISKRIEPSMPPPNMPLPRPPAHSRSNSEASRPPVFTRTPYQKHARNESAPVFPPMKPSTLTRTHNAKDSNSRREPETIVYDFASHPSTSSIALSDHVRSQSNIKPTPRPVDDWLETAPEWIDGANTPPVPPKDAVLPSHMKKSLPSSRR